MKILVITPYFHPHIGGSQRYIEDLYGQLVATDPHMRVDVLCYNTDAQPKTEVINGLHVHRVGCVELLPGQFALPNYLEVWQVVRQLKHDQGSYDVVNSHTRFFDNSWWAPAVAKYLGARSVLTDHCASVPQHPSVIVTTVANGVDRLIAPFVASWYDGITVVSRSTQKYVSKLGFSTSTIIPGGVDTTLFKPGSKSRSKQLTVAFVGRLIPAKGADLFVKMALELQQSYPQVTFVVAGDGPLLPSLKKSANTHLIFTGSLDKTGVAQLLSTTDVFVHPSLHHEGFPLILVEAGASGCAVVATDQGGVKEVLAFGQNSLKIEANVSSLTSQVTKLLEDAHLRTELSQRLHREVVSDFSWDTIAKTYRTYLDKLMSKVTV